MRTVTYRLVDLQKCMIPLGFVGENEHTVVQFDCKKVYDEYPNAVPALTVQPPEGSAYPAVTTRDGDIVSWTVEDSDLVYTGYGEFQLTFSQSGVVVKSYIGRTKIERSIAASGSAPDPVSDWLTEANTALNGIPQAIDDALAEAKTSGEFDGADGQDGADGFSPVVSVSSISGGHRISITDANGTQTTDVMDGVDGQDGAPGDDGHSPVIAGSKSGKTTTITSDGVTIATIQDGSDGQNGQNGQDGTDGYSPTASVTKSGKVSTFTVTDKNGTTTVQINDGEDGSGADIIDDTAGAGDTDKTFSADKLTTELNGVKSAINSMEESIAPVEASATATSAHAVGELFILEDKLLVALSAIAVGDTITTTGATPNAAVTTLSSKLIKDVQVNGSSILNNGVADIPVGKNALGVVREAGMGVGVNTSGWLTLSNANDNNIKQGTSEYVAITPNNQHKSVFHGLAKAAGDTSQSSSSNAVGTYTEDAKSKINLMLGSARSSDLAYVETTDTATKAYVYGDLFVDSSGVLSKITANSVAIGTTLAVNTNYVHIGGNGGMADYIMKPATLVGSVTLEEAPSNGIISVPLSKPCSHLTIDITNNNENIPPWSYIRFNNANSMPALQVLASGNFKRSYCIIDLINKFGITLNKPSSDNYSGNGNITYSVTNNILNNDVVYEIGFCASSASAYAVGFKIDVYGR